MASTRTRQAAMERLDEAEAEEEEPGL